MKIEAVEAEIRELARAAAVGAERVRHNLSRLGLTELEVPNVGKLIVRSTYSEKYDASKSYLSWIDRDSDLGCCSVADPNDASPQGTFAYADTACFVPSATLSEKIRFAKASKQIYNVMDAIEDARMKDIRLARGALKQLQRLDKKKVA